MNYNHKVTEENGAKVITCERADGSLVWQAVHPAFIKDKVTGQLMPDESVIDLGFMKDERDTEGLQKMLRENGIIQEGDVVTNGEAQPEIVAVEIKTEEVKLANGGWLTEQTGLIPNIIAQQVAIAALNKNKNTRRLGIDDKASLAIKLEDKLANTAENLYIGSAHFREKLSQPGTAGRAYLKESMERWAETYINKNDMEKLDDGGIVENENIKKSFLILLTEDYENQKEKYLQIIQNGRNIINADDVKRLWPGYEGHGELSDVLQPAASVFAKRVYSDLLKELPISNYVLFMAGGTGAGKSTSLNGSGVIKSVGEASDIIYDTNMNIFSTAAEKIDAALASGRRAYIAYVYRNPVEAFANGVVPRSMGRKRIVTINNHIDTHLGSLSVIEELQKHYMGKDVDFIVLDNSFEEGGARKSAIAEIKEKPYLSKEELKNKLHEINESKYSNGSISEIQYHGFKGTTPFNERGNGQTQPKGSSEHNHGISPSEPQRPQESREDELGSYSKGGSTEDAPLIVLRAMGDHVTDVGQLSKDEIYQLNKYVKKGVLAKGLGGPFPMAKMTWAIVGYDIQAHRNADVKKLLEDSERLDKIYGDKRLFPKEFAKGGTTEISKDDHEWQHFEKISWPEIKSFFKDKDIAVWKDLVLHNKKTNRLYNPKFLARNLGKNKGYEVVIFYHHGQNDSTFGDIIYNSKEQSFIYRFPEWDIKDEVVKFDRGGFLGKTEEEQMKNIVGLKIKTFRPRKEESVIDNVFYSKSKKDIVVDLDNGAPLFFMKETFADFIKGDLITLSDGTPLARLLLPEEKQRDAFKHGGSVESKVKQKLEDATALTFQLAVYVPSTEDKNKKISPDQMRKRVLSTEKFLADLFGGFSAVEVQGGYSTSDKGVVSEDVTRVTAFALKENFEEKFNKLLAQVKKWGTEWSQEAMGLEFENELYYVNADKKFAEGGIPDKIKVSDITYDAPFDDGTLRGSNRHLILPSGRKLLVLDWKRKYYIHLYGEEDQRADKYDGNKLRNEQSIGELKKIIVDYWNNGVFDKTKKYEEGGEVSEGEQQAANFLKETGTTFSSSYVRHGSHFAGEKETRDIYKITLKNARGEWSFNFGQSIANTGTHPTAYDALSAITKYDPGSFEDFCSEYGYSADDYDELRQSKKIYKGVEKDWVNVNRLFTDEEIEKLQEIQ